MRPNTGHPSTPSHLSTVPCVMIIGRLIRKCHHVARHPIPFQGPLIDTKRRSIARPAGPIVALLSGPNRDQGCIRFDMLLHRNLVVDRIRTVISEAFGHASIWHRRSKRIDRPPAIRPGQEIACRPSWPRTPSSADRWCGPWDPSGCVPPPQRSARTALGSPCR